MNNILNCNDSKKIASLPRQLRGGDNCLPACRRISRFSVVSRHIYTCLYRKRGFTLSELMIAALILAFALVGLLTLFITCLFLNENSRNSTLAYSAMEMKMEELSNENYLNLDSFNGQSFDLNGFSTGSGKGRITVSGDPAVASGLKRINIKACFMNRNRLIGDDINNCQSSPVELITSIAQP